MQPNNDPSQKPADSQQLANHPLAVMQPGERVICDVRRHPIGLIGNYVTAGFIIIVAAIVAFVLVPSFAPQENRNQLLGLALLGFIMVAGFTLLVSLIAATVYKGNRWVVTSDSITQVKQVTLFNKQASQLSLHNLEDVTAEQNGIFQSIFNFGTLRAETAGERSKFVFPFCPHPNQCAQEILAAREKFMSGGAYQNEQYGETRLNGSNSTPGPTA
jgi:uncharacterized membrane protein YdbT with pleckstrin-like domain